MTFEKLCAEVTKGTYSYYSKQFNIHIEPHGDTMHDYVVNVEQNGKLVESQLIEEPLSGWLPKLRTFSEFMVSSAEDNRSAADWCLDKILLVKQELHAKYINL